MHNRLILTERGSEGPLKWLKHYVNFFPDTCTIGYTMIIPSFTFHRGITYEGGGESFQMENLATSQAVNTKLLHSC